MTPVLPGYGDQLADGWIVVLVRADPERLGDTVNYRWHESTWRPGVATEGWWTVMLVRSQPDGEYDERLFVHRPSRGWEEAEPNPLFHIEFVAMGDDYDPYIMRPVETVPWEVKRG